MSPPFYSASTPSLPPPGSPTGGGGGHGTGRKHVINEKATARFAKKILDEQTPEAVERLLQTVRAQPLPPFIS
jgi:hypothetical protein